MRRLNTKYTSDYDLRIYMMVDKNDIVGNTENIELSISENKNLVCIDQTYFPSCQKRMVCKRKRNNYFFSHLISFPGSTHTIAFLQFSFFLTFAGMHVFCLFRLSTEVCIIHIYAYLFELFR